MSACVTEGDARDIAAIMPIMETAFDPRYGEAWTAAQCLSLLALPGTCLLLARTDDRAVRGFALTRGAVDEEELLMIGVAPSHRRQGIARMLVKTAIDRARSAERRRLFLEVRSNNPARLFYENSGFRACGMRKGYYKGSDGLRFDATTMALTL